MPAWLILRLARVIRCPMVDSGTRKALSRMAASEITLRPPGHVGTLAARILTPRIAGHAYLSLIRRFSSVLNNDHI
jgi:FAD-dependent urate hydroxylase